MNSHQLRNFLAVVEHGGIGRAAAALGVAQPTLSQSVRALERELRVTLLRRSNQGTGLSPAGHAFVGPARQLVRDLALARSVTAGRRPQPILRLICEPHLAEHPAAGLLAAFAGARPDILIHLERAGTGDEALARISAGRCQLGLVYRPVNRGGWSAVELGRHRLVLALPPQTSAPPGPAPLTFLHGRPLLAAPPGCAERVLLDEALGAAGVRPRLAVESGQPDLLLRLLLTGAGAAVLPEPAATGLAAHGAVVRPLDPPLALPFGLVHPAARLAPASAAFLAHVLG